VERSVVGVVSVAQEGRALIIRVISGVVVVSSISCAKGTTQQLSKPCEGKCNIPPGRGYSARQYKGCETAKQCIKISEWEDSLTHCWDRSDEKEEQKPSGDDVDWDMKKCHNGNTNKLGLSCAKLMLS
jgi:hypothetical protein